MPVALLRRLARPCRLLELADLSTRVVTQREHVLLDLVLAQVLHANGPCAAVDWFGVVWVWESV